MEYRIAGAGDIALLVQSRMDTLRAVNRLDTGYQFSGINVLGIPFKRIADGADNTILRTT